LLILLIETHVYSRNRKTKGNIHIFWLDAVYIGGQRPPLQMPIKQTTLKLQIHAVATGVDRRK